MAPFNDNPIFEALELPTHIGVILFVLLSGYFGIRPTSKGFLKLMFVFFIYSLPELYFKVVRADSLKELISSLFFFSHTHFWFIRTYVFLYLLSPLVNHYLDGITNRQRGFILFVLFSISIYVGTIGGDSSLSDGKNVVNFILIYIVGNTLQYYREYINKIRLSNLLISFVILNIMLVFGYFIFSNSIVGKILWRLSFPYCSPILLLNSVIFFLIFSKFSFQSKMINWLAQSSLAIYLIHGNRPLFIDWNGISDSFPGGLIGFIVHNVSGFIANDVLLGISLLGVAITVICITIGIDKLLSPLWNFGNRLFNRIYLRLGY